MKYNAKHIYYIYIYIFYAYNNKIIFVHQKTLMLNAYK